MFALWNGPLWNASPKYFVWWVFCLIMFIQIKMWRLKTNCEMSPLEDRWSQASKPLMRAPSRGRGAKYWLMGWEKSRVHGRLEIDCIVLAVCCKESCLGQDCLTARYLTDTALTRFVPRTHGFPGSLNYLFIVSFLRYWAISHPSLPWRWKQSGKIWNSFASACFPTKNCISGLFMVE